MSKTVWLKRSEEWIKANPKKGTMYKAEMVNNEPVEISVIPQEIKLINAQKVKIKIEQDENDKIAKIQYKAKRLDQGIYIIKCEAVKKVYVGQSINMGSRLRGHKMIIISEFPNENMVYNELRQDAKANGIENIEFTKLKHLPGLDQTELNKAENNTMLEYIDLGYTLYNRKISGINYYCPPNLIDVFNAIKLANLSSDKIAELSNIISNL